MKKAISLMILFVGMSVIATECIAKAPNYIPVSISDIQKVIFTQGRPILVSETNDTAIAISMNQGPKEVYFDIAVRKKSDAEMDIIPENIRVTGYNKKDAGKPLDVYSPGDYIKKIANKAAWNIFLQGLVGACNSFTSGTSSTTVRDSNGNVLAQSTTYDPAKTSQVAAQDQANIEKAGIQGKNEIEQASKFLLWRNTLQTGVIVEGNVVAKYNGSFKEKYKVVIPIGPDVYEVQFITQ